MSVNTKEGNELLHLQRPLHGRHGGGPFCLCCRWFECCHQSIEVFSGSGTANPGKRLGRVREICMCNPCVGHSFSVRDHKDREHYKVVGNCIDCCCTYHMRIEKDGEKVGSLNKEWGGLAREALTDADRFKVKFPADAGGDDRALLFAALFLVDFLEFENNQRKRAA